MSTIKEMKLEEVAIDKDTPCIVGKITPLAVWNRNSFNGFAINKRHTSAADRQAFDTLYKSLQDIGTITQRAIREGDRGHKLALHKIMRICRSVE